MTEKTEYKIDVTLYCTDPHYLLETLVPKIMRDTIESKCRYEVGELLARKVE